MRIRLAVVLALVLTLGACGGSDEPDPKPKAEASSSPAEKPAMDAALPQIPDGKPAPEALTDFECTRDDEGAWTASGAVTNDTKRPATFQVTAHVGPADGQGAAARTKRINGVQPNGAVGFDLGEIESRSSDGPCHVQVLTLSERASG